MNLSESEFRSKDLRSRANNVGQAFQPADGDWLRRDAVPRLRRGGATGLTAPPLDAAVPTQRVEREHCGDFQGSPSILPLGTAGLHAYAPLGLHKEEAASCRFTNAEFLTSYAPGRLRRLDILHEEVQRQEAAAPPRALEGRQRVAQGKRGQEPLAPPWVKSSNKFSPLPPESPAFGRFGGRGRERGVARCQLATLASRWCPNVSRFEA